MIICPYCGKQISPDSRFCEECGRELPIIPDSMTREEDRTERLSSYAPPQETVELQEPKGKRRKSRIDDSYMDEEEEAYFREDRKTVLVGVILAGLICVVGIGLYFITIGMLNRAPEKQESSGLGDKRVQMETVATPVPEKEQTDQQEANPETNPEETAGEQPANIQAFVTTVSGEELASYAPVGISSSIESSYLVDDGMYHYSSLMVDGNPSTSWQEGDPGDGSGQWAQFGFDRPYLVKYITFRMGNWASDYWFEVNNRPQTVLLTLDDRSFQLTFQDGLIEQTVEFTEPCPASSLNLQVLSVYKGSRYDDCCIAEMHLYGM